MSKSTEEKLIYETRFVRPKIRYMMEEVKKLHRKAFEGTGFHTDCYLYVIPCTKCSAPVWGGVCPICGYYPMGIEYNTPPCSLEQYESAIFAHGNFAAWFFAQRRTMAGYHNGWNLYKEINEQLITDALSIDCPTPEEIWSVRELL